MICDLAFVIVNGPFGDPVTLTKQQDSSVGNMYRRTFHIVFIFLVLGYVRGLNLPPFFTADMNQFTLTENTQVGSAVYTLEGEDPEGSRVRFGIQGTDKFEVDPNTGVVTVALPIDRESQTEINNNEIRLVSFLLYHSTIQFNRSKIRDL